jgi:hypothetical protein
VARHSYRAPNDRRIKRCFALIRRVRGRATLEALFRLQGGLCAYDEQPCALLIPEIFSFATDMLKPGEIRRFATVDHVTPRALGGNNTRGNLVMASQIQNCKKGALEPIIDWEPRFAHSSVRLGVTTAAVDEDRWTEARWLAGSSDSPHDILRNLVSDQLALLRSTVKFYTPPSQMVA